MKSYFTDIQIKLANMHIIRNVIAMVKMERRLKKWNGKKWLNFELKVLAFFTP